MAALLLYTDMPTYYDTTYVSQLATDAGDSGSGPANARITALIAAAESDLRGALSKQYTDAQMEADASVKAACATMVMYMLEERKGQGHTEPVEKAYIRVLQKIMKVQAGDDKLSAVTQLVPTVNPTEAQKVMEQSSYFTGYVELNP